LLILESKMATKGRKKFRCSLLLLAILFLTNFLQIEPTKSGGSGSGQGGGNKPPNEDPKGKKPAMEEPWLMSEEDLERILGGSRLRMGRQLWAIYDGEQRLADKLQHLEQLRADHTQLLEMLKRRREEGASKWRETNMADAVHTAEVHRLAMGLGRQFSAATAGEQHGSAGK
jgi:hypothetical protein